MTRIAALSLDQAPAGSRAALEGIQKGLGFIPNVFKTLAHSPAALSGYQSLAQALGKTSLSAVEREVLPSLRQRSTVATTAWPHMHSLGPRLA